MLENEVHYSIEPKKAFHLGEKSLLHCKMLWFLTFLTGFFLQNN